MEFDTYVQRERVQAAQVLKPTNVVLSTGPLVVDRYSYIVTRTLTDEFGIDHTETSVLTKDEFNDKYTRLNWREEDRQNAYNEGYEEGWKACETAHDFAESVVDSSHADQEQATADEHDDSDSAGAAAGGHTGSGEGEGDASDLGARESSGVPGEDPR